jgi:hypothetical protein
VYSSYDADGRIINIQAVSTLGNSYTLSASGGTEPSAGGFVRDITISRKFNCFFILVFTTRHVTITPCLSLSPFSQQSHIMLIAPGDVRICQPACRASWPRSSSSTP